MFTIHEIVWWTVSELEDWLYPYKDRLTPEESFQIRVKDFDTGENYMVEELIQSQNERIERLQDEMINVQNKLVELDHKLKTRMKMNQQTKINFILEHIAHIDDLIKDNIDEALLSASLRDIKFLLEKQLQTIHERKGIAR